MRKEGKSAVRNTFLCLALLAALLAFGILFAMSHGSGGTYLAKAKRTDMSMNRPPVTATVKKKAPKEQAMHAVPTGYEVRELDPPDGYIPADGDDKTAQDVQDYGKAKPDTHAMIYKEKHPGLD